MTTPHQPGTWLLPKPRFGDLIRLLQQDGFEVIGPKIEQQAIVYSPIQTAEDLPIGWTDRQAPGSYRLEKRQDDAYFGYAVGPHSWKKYLFPPTLRLWQAQRTEDGFEVLETMPDPPRRAFLGVRACELHAIAVQDKVFLERAASSRIPTMPWHASGCFSSRLSVNTPAEHAFAPRWAPDRRSMIGRKETRGVTLHRLLAGNLCRSDPLPRRPIIRAFLTWCSRNWMRRSSFASAARPVRMC